MQRLVVLGGLLLVGCGDNATPAGEVGADDAQEAVDAAVDGTIGLPQVPDIDAAPPDASPPDDRLVVEPAALDFGLVEAGTSAMRTVSIANRSSTPATLALSIDGRGLSRLATTCGANLAAGARCELIVRFAPTGLGAVDGAVAIASDRGAASVPIAATGAGRLTLVVSGAGTVSGLDRPCTASCSTLAAVPVTLRATAAGGARWVGWSTGCGAADTCAVSPAPWPTEIGARFAAVGSAPVLAIALAGDAPGEVVIRTGGVLHRCPGECALAVPRGATVELFATTPSAFAGWSGGGCPDAGACTLRVSADAAVTARFARDRGEVWTQVMPEAALRPVAVAFDGAGDLRVVSAAATGTRLVAMTAAGAVVWTAPLSTAAPVQVLGLELDRAGDAFVWSHEGPVGAGSRYLLRKLSPTGALLWTRTFPATGAAYRDDQFYDDLAVTPAGDAAVVLDGLRLIRADGSLGRSVPVAEIRALAFDAAGDVLAAARSGGGLDPTVLLRFSAGGDRLPDVGTLIGFDAELTVDAADAPVAVSSTRAQVAVQRLGPRGFVITTPVHSARNLPSGIAIDGRGRIDDVRWQSDAAVGGMVLRQLDPTGALEWQLDKPTQPRSWGTEGVTPVEIAADHRGRVAVVGRWTGSRTGWIAVYQPAP